MMHSSRPSMPLTWSSIAAAITSIQNLETQTSNTASCTGLRKNISVGPPQSWTKDTGQPGQTLKAVECVRLHAFVFLMTCSDPALIRPCRHTLPVANGDQGTCDIMVKWDGFQRRYKAHPLQVQHRILDA